LSTSASSSETRSSAKSRGLALAGRVRPVAWRDVSAVYRTDIEADRDGFAAEIHAPPVTLERCAQLHVAALPREVRHLAGPQRHRLPRTHADTGQHREIVHRHAEAARTGLEHQTAPAGVGAWWCVAMMEFEFDVRSFTAHASQPRMRGEPPFQGRNRAARGRHGRPEHQFQDTLHRSHSCLRETRFPILRMPRVRKTRVFRKRHKLVIPHWYFSTFAHGLSHPIAVAPPRFAIHTRPTPEGALHV
jgi:hypothetical protein